MLSQEKVTNKVTTNNNRYLAQLSIIAGSFLLKSVDSLRNILPEPFDYFDHAGNLNASWQVGYFTAFGIGKIMAREANSAGTELSERKARKYMVFGAAIIGAAINSVTETKFGQSLIPLADSTADTIDLAYGVVGAAIGATIPTVSDEYSKRNTPSSLSETI